VNKQYSHVHSPNKNYHFVEAIWESFFFEKN
jgi:hypothetical protein